MSDFLFNISGVAEVLFRWESNNQFLMLMKHTC